MLPSAVSIEEKKKYLDFQVFLLTGIKNRV